MMALEVLKYCMSDMYHTDVYHEDGSASYIKWAANELEEYIREKIFPRTEATLEEYYSITTDYMTLMEHYVTLNSMSSIIFRCASLVAADVLDWLEASGAF